MFAVQNAFSRSFSRGSVNLIGVGLPRLIATSVVIFKRTSWESALHLFACCYWGVSVERDAVVASPSSHCAYPRPSHSFAVERYISVSNDRAPTKFKAVARVGLEAKVYRVIREQDSLILIQKWRSASLSADLNIFTSFLSLPNSFGGLFVNLAYNLGNSKNPESLVPLPSPVFNSCNAVARKKYNVACKSGIQRSWQS